MTVISKAHLYSPADQQISFYSSFMNYPGRLDILRDLSSNGPKNVHEIASLHPLSLSAVSQHLEFMRERHLLDFEPQFPFLNYYVNREVFEIARTCIKAYLDSI